MSGQRSLAHLRRTEFYQQLVVFAGQEEERELKFSPKVNSTQREDIRQICRHLELSFKTHGEGS